MPNEILARILGSLYKDELLPCRLVNKQLGAIATRELAKQRFTILPIHFSSYGLQALVDICTHPELGVYVRGISISPLRTSTAGFWRLTKSFEESLTTGNPEDVDNAHSFLQSHIQACRDEHMLKKSGQATRLITTALATLRQRGISAEVSIHNGLSYGTIGWRQTYRDRGHKMERETHERMNATIHIMFHAIFRSGCKVSSLQIVQNGNYDLDGLQDSIDLAESMDHVLHAFVDLRSLDLTFKKMPEQKTLDSLDSILGHLYCLEKLKIEFDCDPDSNSLNGRIDTESVLASNTLLGSLSSECLREIKLENVCISKKRLIRMLKASRDCIERLEFHYVCLCSGSWYTVMSWIRDNLLLNRLELFALFEIDESDPNEEGYHASAWREDRLDEMLNSMEENMASDLDWTSFSRRVMEQVSRTRMKQYREHRGIFFFIK